MQATKDAQQFTLILSSNFSSNFSSNLSSCLAASVAASVACSGSGCIASCLAASVVASVACSGCVVSCCPLSNFSPVLASCLAASVVGSVACSGSGCVASCCPLSAVVVSTTSISCWCLARHGFVCSVGSIFCLHGPVPVSRCYFCVCCDSSGRGCPFRARCVLWVACVCGTPAVWTQALAPFLNDPARYPRCVVHHDDEFVCIYDKYPKATHHLLLLPRTTGSAMAPVDLTGAHLPMLRQLERRAMAIIAAMSASVPSTAVFRLGFHAVPSLPHLHLHIISADLVTLELCCCW